MPVRSARAVGKVKNTGNQKASFVIRLFLQQRDLLGDVVDTHGQDRYTSELVPGETTASSLVIDTAFANPPRYFTMQPGEVLERTVVLYYYKGFIQGEDVLVQLERQDFADYVEPEPL